MAYECAPLSEYIPLIQVLLLRKVASLFGIRIEYLFRNQLIFIDRSSADKCVSGDFILGDVWFQQKQLDNLQHNVVVDG